MKAKTVWTLFALGTVVWLLLNLWLAPQENGPDVMIFRDAGWNLAASGHFETIGLIYARDLKPHLFAHYTPLMPLLFAAYLKIFPQNAYAGTIFNLLLGYAASACALFWVLKCKFGGSVKTVAALMLALFPVALITVDRPEALGLFLSVLFLGHVAHVGSKSWISGMLAALLFLAAPYAALMAMVWCFFYSLGHKGLRLPGRVAARTMVGAAAGFLLLLLPVATLFEALDRQAWRRFAQHALGVNSGVGHVLQNHSGLILRLGDMPIWQHLHWHGLSTIHELNYIAPGILLAGYMLWAGLSWRRSHEQQKLLLAAGVGVVFFTICLFPVQYNYLSWLAFFLPVAVLICSKEVTAQKPALILLLGALMTVYLPDQLTKIPIRAGERASCEAEKSQLDFLAKHLDGSRSIVAFQGNVYDYYKPRFPYLFNVFYLQNDAINTVDVAAVVNCYRAYDGSKGALQPFPAGIDSAHFHLLQASPEHVHPQVFGRPMAYAEWGFGCDVYLRNSLLG